jgi:hypothetical protein
MLGAGTVINPLIKIITTVAILGAVYLFIVKPALDTTNNAFDSFSESFNGFENLPGHVQTQIDNALQDTDVDTVNVGRLQDCIQNTLNTNADVAANQNRIDRCLRRFGP